MRLKLSIRLRYQVAVRFELVKGEDEARYQVIYKVRVRY